MHSDYCLERMLKNRDVLAKIYFIVWIGSICATISFFIGGVFMIYLAMSYLGLV
mgnify:CR=1 FL=1